MNNRGAPLKNRIRGARYVAGAGLPSKLENTLAHLPDDAVSPFPRKALMNLAAAILVVLFLGFAAPPVVRAAVAGIERLFGHMSAEEAAFVNLPEDEKVQYALVESEKYLRGHDLMAQAEFGGATITLKHVQFCPNAPDDADDQTGYMQAVLVYDAQPTFNPNQIDFVIRYADHEYTMPGTSGVLIDDFQSNTAIHDGIVRTDLLFDVDEWILSGPTDIKLTGTLKDKSFEIPFTFDPEKAHKAAVDAAPEDAKVYAQMSEERAKAYAELDSAASEVGIVKDVDGFKFNVTDIALTDDGHINIGWMIMEIAGENRKSAAFNHYIEELTVDGYPSPWAGGSDSMLEDGVLMLREYKPLGRSIANLPTESLLSFMFVRSLDDGDETRVPVAFKYNWAEKKATHPKDADEEAKWIEESRALREAVVASAPAEMIWSFEKGALTQTKGDMTMTITQLRIDAENNRLEIEFDLSSENKSANGQAYANWGTDSTLTIDGNAAEPNSSSEMDGRPSGIDFILPCHASEIRDGAKVRFTYPVSIEKDGEVIEKESFTFDLTLDLKEAK